MVLTPDQLTALKNIKSGADGLTRLLESYSGSRLNASHPREACPVPLEPLPGPEPSILMSGLSGMSISRAVRSRLLDAYLRGASKLRDQYEASLSLSCARLQHSQADGIPAKSSRIALRDTYVSMYRRQLQELATHYTTNVAASAGRDSGDPPSIRASRCSGKTFNQDFMPVLEYMFAVNPRPSHADKAFLAKKSGMAYRQIHVWFQNRRSRSKKADRESTPHSNNIIFAFDDLIQRMGHHIIPEKERLEPLDSDASEYEWQYEPTDDEHQCNQSAEQQIVTSQEAFPFQRPLYAFPAAYPYPGGRATPSILPVPCWHRRPSARDESPCCVDVDDLCGVFLQLHIQEVVKKRLVKKKPQDAFHVPEKCPMTMLCKPDGKARHRQGSTTPETNSSPRLRPTGCSSPNSPVSLWSPPSAKRNTVGPVGTDDSGASDTSHRTGSPCHSAHPIDSTPEIDEHVLNTASSSRKRRVLGWRKYSRNSTCGSSGSSYSAGPGNHVSSEHDGAFKTPSSMHQFSLRQKLARVEDHFLDAAIQGPAAMDRFSEAWRDLQQEIDANSQSDDADSESIALAFAVASRIELLANHFLEMEVEHDKLTSAFMNDLQGILGDPKLDSSQQSVRDFHQEDTPSTATSQDNQTSFLYRQPCYKWLLQHLYDPYPSKDLKRSIADSTGSSVASIDTWFQTARRRMGWTKLQRQYFNNSRREMVDCARRILLEDDDTRAEDSLLTHEFLEMKAKAQTLFSCLFKKSKLAAELDVAVKDMSEGDWERASIKKDEELAAKKRRRALEKELQRLDRAKQRTETKLKREYDNCPSPAVFCGQSRAASRVPSLTRSLSSQGSEEDGLEEWWQHADISAPHSTLSRKRKASSSGTEVAEAGVGREPLMKRQRSARDSYELDSAQCDVSVEFPSLLVDVAPTSDQSHLDDAFTTLLAASGSSCRKCPLSVGDCDSLGKCPQGIHPEPQPACHPLPSQSIFTDESLSSCDWENLFRLEAPGVGVEDMDITAELDIQLCDKWPSVVFNGEQLDDINKSDLLTSSEDGGRDGATDSGASHARSNVPSSVLSTETDTDASAMIFPDLFADSLAQLCHDNDALSLSQERVSSPARTDHPRSPVGEGTDGALFLAEEGLSRQVEVSKDPPISGLSAQDLLYADFTPFFPTPSQIQQALSTVHTSEASLPQTGLVYPGAHVAELLALDRRTKEQQQQYFALKQAATQVEQEVLVALVQVNV